MKQLTAIIKPFKLDEVREALQAVGITNMTVCEVKGFGAQKGTPHLYRNREYPVDWVPKVLILMVVPDNQVEQAIDAITTAGRSGRIGDGRIIVTPVEAFWHIRTKTIES